MDTSPTPATAALARFKFMGNATITSVLVGVALLAVVVVIAMIVYNLRKSDIRMHLIVKQPLRLGAQHASFKVIPDTNIPTEIVGQEFAYSVWLYIQDYPATDKDKAIFHRAPTPIDFANANPVVTMDKRTNSLTFFVSTTAPDTTNANVPPTLEAPRHYLPVTIDFVPLQRWVMVTLAVRDRVATAYLDDAVYVTVTVDDKQTSPTVSRPIFRKASVGSVYVGRYNSSNVQTFEGLVTRLTYFNYSVTHRDIQRLFSRGPNAASFFARMGLPAYGVRSPVYRLESVTNSL
jgi:hypothetical protein